MTPDRRAPPPVFLKTVSVGDVLQVVVLLVALALGFSSVRERITLLEFKVDQLWQLSLPRR